MVWGHLYLIRLWDGVVALLDWTSGVVLLALLDWAVGVGMLAWVSHGYISTSGCLVPVPQSKLVHLGQQLGDILCHQSPPLASAGVSHQMLGTGRPLHGMASFWVIWA